MQYYRHVDCFTNEGILVVSVRDNPESATVPASVGVAHMNAHLSEVPSVDALCAAPLKIASDAFSSNYLATTPAIPR
jgi:hypothetical protein